MEKFKVFVARKIPEIGTEMLKKAGFDVDVNEDEEKVLTKLELIEKVKNKDALLSLLTDEVDEEVLSSAENLKIVSNYAVGLDNVDIDAATRRGILVSNTPGVLTQSVAEHTFALMIGVARRIVEADKYTRQGKYRAWGPLLFLGADLNGKTLGIIGLGRIGKAVSKMAVRGFDMKVLYYDKFKDEAFEKEYNAEDTDLETLLTEADFITIHVPLLPSTIHLISFNEFKLMKKGAILVNTARGPIIDEKALIDALENKRIAGAALDVFECEPEISCDHKSSHQLKDQDNLILTPHIASASIETRGKMAELAAQSIIDLAGGKTPQNVVNTEALKK